MGSLRNGPLTEVKGPVNLNKILSAKFRRSELSTSRVASNPPFDKGESSMSTKLTLTLAAFVFTALITAAAAGPAQCRVHPPYAYCR
jgi:hypothetical protein